MTRGQVMVGFSESGRVRGMPWRVPDQLGFDYWVGQLTRERPHST